MMPTKQLSTHLILLTSSLLALSACGGGGSSSGGHSQSNGGGVDEDPHPILIQQDEPPQGEDLNPERLAYATDDGGEVDPSVNIAIVDTGIDPNHQSFAEGNDLGNPVVTGGFDAVDLRCDAIGGSECDDSELADENGHGTAVGSVVGGSRTGYSGNARLTNADVSRKPGGSARLDDITAALGESARRNNAIANVSYGVDMVGVYNTDYDVKAYVRAELGELIEQNMLVVSSAGNEGESFTQRHGTDDTWAEDDPLLGQVLITGGLDDEDGLIHASSNTAGDDELVQSRFISADWTNRAALSRSGDQAYGDFNGTSSAAPAVVGTLSTMLAKWSYLEPDEAAAIVLETADQDFDDYSAEVYGQGRLNSSAALAPVGEPQVMSGATLSDNSHSLRATALDNARPGVGVSLALADALSDVRVFDDYGRGYRADLSERVTQRSTPALWSGEALDARLRRADTEVQNTTAYRGLSAQFHYSAETGALRGGSIKQALPNTALHAFALPEEPSRKETNTRFAPLLTPTHALSRLPGSAEAAEAEDLRQGVRVDHALSARISAQAHYSESASALGAPRTRGRDVADLAITFSPTDHIDLEAGFSSVDQHERFLGLVGSGALSTNGGASSALPRVGVRLTRPAYSLFADYQWGQVAGEYTGLVQSVEADVASASIGGHVALDQTNSSLSAVVSMPLHIERASVRLSLPDGRDKDGAIDYRSEHLRFKETNRPMDIEIGYQKNLGASAQFSFNVLHRERDGKGQYGATITGHKRF